MTRYDIAIIGTGPAGLEAAITAKVRNKNIILFGSKDLSQKMQVVKHPILNYLGLPSKTGVEMANVFQQQLDELGISIIEEKVSNVYAMGEYFALQLNNSEMVEATSVILAMGVAAGKPYTGEEQFLGRGVSYCATCDAPLYKGKVVAVVAGSQEEEAEADFLGEVCEKVYYFPQYKDEPQLNSKNIEIHYEKPVEIKGMMKANTLKTDQSEYAVDCVFILRPTQFPGSLVPGLEIEGNAVKVDLQMKTNLPGLFAAGDITGQPYQYIKAAGQGNVAALSAVAYVDELKRKKQQVINMAGQKIDALKLENQLCFPLYAAARKITAAYTPILKPLEMTYTQYIVFLVLWEKDDISVGELCERLYLDSGTITPLLKKMEDKNWLTRTRSKLDERVVMIKLTKEGKNMKKHCADIPAKVRSCVCLNQDESLDLYKALYKILEEKK